MKKILKSICLALAVLGGGIGVTSCDSETISQVLGLLLGGTPSTYSGTATIECLQGTYEPMNYTKAQRNKKIQLFLLRRKRKRALPQKNARK